MKNFKRIFITILSISMLLCGCKGNSSGKVNSSLSNEEKTTIYKAYIDNLPDKVKPESYYFYDLHYTDQTFNYSIYNKDGYKQYVFGGKDKDGVIVDIDDQYAYLFLDCFKDQSGDVIRTEINDSVLELVSKYEMDINSILTNIEFVSFDQNPNKTEDNEYYDDVSLKASIDGKEYTGICTCYINDNKEVKLHENLDALLLTSLENDNQTIGLTVYENKDVQNEREEQDYVDVSLDEFIQTLNTEIEKLQ